MNLKYKILPLTVLLAVGIALTACGSSGAPASTPASSAVPASSHVAEEGVTEPINMLTWTLDDLDREDTVTFIPAEITSGVQGGSLAAKIFSYDLYKKRMLKTLPLGIRSPSTKRGCMEPVCDRCSEEHREKRSVPSCKHQRRHGGAERS